MPNDPLSSLLNAQSVAVVGASDKPSSFGGQVFQNLVNFGFPGSVYAVHPRLTELFGQPCYPSLSALPEQPDCVALAVSNRHLLALLTEAAELGIPGAVIFGDPNIGLDRNTGLEAQIQQIAHEKRMAICGPNAMGFYNLSRKLVISGYPIRPDTPAGNIALITHSGTVFDALTQNNRDVHFNYVISGGNEAVATAADYLKYVLMDPLTKIAACYLETIRDPEGFIEALELSHEKQIPIVVLKVGLSERGQVMTQAHTGALAGDTETYLALFRRYGVMQVRCLDEMMDTIELLSYVQRLDQPHMTVLMESGGERSLLADLASEAGIPFSSLSQKTEAQLADILEPGVSIGNPLDAFGTGKDVVGTYYKCVLALHDDPNTGLLLMAIDLARDSYLSPAYVEAALRALEQLKKPFVWMVNLTAGANEELVRKLRKEGVPVLMGTETGLRAIRHLMSYSYFVSHPISKPEVLGRPASKIVAYLRDKLKKADSPLDEHASKKLLTIYGLRSPREEVVCSGVKAVEAAECIGYPIVLKTATEKVLHKSDVGGVYLHLENAHQVNKAYQLLADKFGPKVLVQEAVRGGIEMILGMKTDPQFGPVLLLGLGGLFVEVFQVIQTAIPPLTFDQATSLLSLLHGHSLLESFRGREALDKVALIDSLLRFSTFVTDLGDLISEIDINPLVVLPSGAMMVDALIVPKGKKNPSSQRTAERTWEL